MKEFASASKAAAAPDDLIEFKLDGDVFHARRMKDATLAYLVAQASDTTDHARIVTAVLDFMEKALTPESARLFRKRMLDPEDGFDMEIVIEVFRWLLGEVAGGKAGGPPRASSSRQRSGGRASTGTASARASTR